MRNTTVNSLFIFSFAALVLSACSTSPEENSFTDCAGCPEMLKIPAGSFLMGTAVADRAIDPGSGRPNANEEPQHEVIIARPFAMGKYEITVAQFAAFVNDTGYDASVGCIRLTGPRRLRTDPELDWRNPGFAQPDNDPVVCVSLEHAIAYTEWLSNKTGFNYYIPSEAQWEYAAKAGTTGRYFWGDDPAMACTYANVNFKEDPPPCDDGYPGIAPVGQFEPNPFGLHDAVSNVWEWTPDCAHKNYVGAPTDGSAWIDKPDCQLVMIRSGGVRNVLARTTQVVRAGRPRNGTSPNLGFRVARSLGDEALVVNVASAGSMPAYAWPTDSEGGLLFQENCALCHTDPADLKGVYGTDRETIRKLITIGGNNIMSMPAYQDRISAEEIDLITDYLLEQKDWQ